MTEKVCDEGHPLVPNPWAEGKWYCSVCKNRKSREWGAANRDRVNDAGRRWRSKNHDELLAKRRTQYEIDKERLKAERDELRVEVLSAYGGHCQCCVESAIEFLAIDHINGGGRKHRAEIGQNIYPWLKRHGFPKGFRVLCHNCNMAIGLYGYCPHEKETNTTRRIA